MSHYVHIAPRAWKDIRRILKMLTKRSPRGAEAWYRAFWQCSTAIAANPMGYAVVEEALSSVQEVRQSLFKTRRGRRYRIVFTLLADDVIILRVRRPGQQPLRRRDLP